MCAGFMGMPVPMKPLFFSSRPCRRHVTSSIKPVYEHIGANKQLFISPDAIMLVPNRRTLFGWQGQAYAKALRSLAPKRLCFLILSLLYHRLFRRSIPTGHIRNIHFPPQNAKTAASAAVFPPPLISPACAPLSIPGLDRMLLTHSLRQEHPGIRLHIMYKAYCQNPLKLWIASLEIKERKKADEC